MASSLVPVSMYSGSRRIMCLSRPVFSAQKLFRWRTTTLRPLGLVQKQLRFSSSSPDAQQLRPKTASHPAHDEHAEDGPSVSLSAQDIRMTSETPEPAPLLLEPMGALRGAGWTSLASAFVIAIFIKGGLLAEPLVEPLYPLGAAAALGAANGVRIGLSMDRGREAHCATQGTILGLVTVAIFMPTCFDEDFGEEEEEDDDGDRRGERTGGMSSSSGASRVGEQDSADKGRNKCPIPFFR